MSCLSGIHLWVSYVRRLGYDYNTTTMGMVDSEPDSAVRDRVAASQLGVQDQHLSTWRQSVRGDFVEYSPEPAALLEYLFWYSSLDDIFEYARVASGSPTPCRSAF